MADATRCWLIRDGAGDGPWNMAVDEALLECVSRQRVPVLRLYGWDRPTLSLGYFQASEHRRQHAASRDCPVVRRASGGGAIVHDRELTYSLSIPTSDRRAAASRQLYGAVHTALVEALGDFGLQATLWQGVAGDGEPPFLCFLRRGEGDLLIGEHKIGGSAQRRVRGAVLQHGSVLLETSRHAPEIAGLNQITKFQIDEAALFDSWLDRLSVGLQMTWQPDSLPSEVAVMAQRLREAKYSAARWTARR